MNTLKKESKKPFYLRIEFNIYVLYDIKWFEAVYAL